MKRKLNSVLHENRAARWLATGAMLLASFGLGTVAKASNPGLPFQIDPNVTSIAPAPDGGFWEQLQEDQVCPPNCATTPPGYTRFFDGAPVYDSVHHAGSIAAAPNTYGYWIVTPQGAIHARGGAPELCSGSLGSCSGFGGGPPSVIVSIAATPTGKGFWALGLDGKVWTAGDAVSYGDAQDSGGYATAIAAAPDGKGYCISISDGGVYCRGEGGLFHGAHPPTDETITGIAFYIDSSNRVAGYWLLAKDGGVFSFDAPFWGSSGGNASFIVNIISFPQPGQNAANPQTTGYAFVDGNNGDITVFRPQTAPQSVAASPFDRKP